MGWADQATATVRCEWGPVGVTEVPADVVVVVDVLRFTTAVDAAVSHGVAVHPYRWRDASTAAFAASVGAVLADGSPGAPSLSPASLLALAPGSSVVLPSPNGSTCAALAAASGAIVVAACLRNASAVGTWLASQPDVGSVTVVPCGERWPDGSLRPALEDHLGAGAVVAALPPTWSMSPEADAAETLWRSVADEAGSVLARCSSGRQQVDRGWEDDLAYATEVGSSRSVPLLTDGRFTDVAS